MSERNHFVDMIGSGDTIVAAFRVTTEADEHGRLLVADMGLWSTFGADFAAASPDRLDALHGALRAVFEELRPDLAYEPLSEPEPLRPETKSDGQAAGAK